MKKKRYSRSGKERGNGKEKGRNVRKRKGKQGK